MPQYNSTLTIADFCEKYQISRAAYYRNAKRGRMPHAIKVGGATRILVTDELVWIAQQRREAL